MAKFTVNTPPKPATAWHYGGKMVKAGDEVEVNDDQVDFLTRRGMIGTPATPEPNAALEKRNLVPSSEVTPGVIFNEPLQVKEGDLPDPAQGEDRAERNRNKPGRNARPV